MKKHRLNEHLSLSTRMDQLAPASFETSLSELQQIVSRLEDGSLGLEQSLSEFERGVKLLRTCYTILEDAEQKVELLVGFNDQEQPVTVPFDATATYDAQEQAVGRRRPKKKPAAPPPVEPPADDSSGALF